jgi:hypothetical protein
LVMCFISTSGVHPMSCNQNKKKSWRLSGKWFYHLLIPALTLISSNRQKYQSSANWFDVKWNRFPIEELFSSWYSPTFSTLDCKTMVGSNLLPLYLSEQIYWKSLCFLHLDSISGNNFCGRSDIVAEFRCMLVNIEFHLASWPNMSAFYMTTYDITMIPTHLRDSLSYNPRC